MATRSLKIEMVLPTLYPAGMEVMTARLTRALGDQGHDVGITCLDGAGALADELRRDGYRVSMVRAPGLHSNVYASELQRWFRRRQPDVVHAHSGVWLKAARAARRASVPCIVYTAHGLPDWEPWFMPALARWAQRHTDHIVAVSEPLRAYVARQAGVDNERIHVIPNGVDTVRFRPGSRSGILRARLGVSDTELLIGNVARLEYVKNHDLLLEAFVILRSHVPNVRLVVIGEGQLRQHLTQRIVALGLERHVHLFGSISDVADAYRDFDLFALSSRGEGTSMSVLEAMASGVCVLATGVGGTPDLLDYGRCGGLVTADDSAQLATMMCSLLVDTGRRRELAHAARQRAVTRYSQTMMLQAYERLFYSRKSDAAAMSA